MVHILGGLGSISGPHCRVNKWSTSFRSGKIVVSDDFSKRCFQRGCRVFVFVSGVLVQKQAFQKESWQNLPFAIFCSGGCCFMLLESGGILFREYCFGGENSLSSAANSASSARNSVSSHLHTNHRMKGTH